MWLLRTGTQAPSIGGRPLACVLLSESTAPQAQVAAFGRLPVHLPHGHPPGQCVYKHSTDPLSKSVAGRKIRCSTANEDVSMTRSRVQFALCAPSCSSRLSSRCSFLSAQSLSKSSPRVETRRRSLPLITGTRQG